MADDYPADIFDVRDMERSEAAVDMAIDGRKPKPATQAIRDWRAHWEGAGSGKPLRTLWANALGADERREYLAAEPKPISQCANCAMWIADDIMPKHAAYCAN